MDLLVLSEVRWGYFRTRKQFLLSRFPARWRIFFAQPPAARADDPWQPRREGNVVTFTVPFLKPGTTSPAYNALMRLPPARALVEAAALTWLERALARLGVAPEPVIMASNIYAALALSRLRRKLIFYDFNDSPFQFSATPPWAHPYWRRTLARVDFLFVVSEYYRRTLSRQTSRPLVWLGNGVETAHFATPRAVPAALASLPRPRVGYVGLLSHFLDFDVLEHVRREVHERRGGTLALLGPGSPATDEQVRALAARPGVALLGPVAYDTLPGWMQGLDLGLIPFRADDPYVQGINPNKTWQYLAAGLPVVTTPLLDLAPSPPHVQFASGPGAWIEAVGAALGAPSDAAARAVRVALAQPHDWDALARRMVDEIERRLAAVA